MMPQTAAKDGSHTLGDAFFRTRLLGTSLRASDIHSVRLDLMHFSPADIEEIEDRQAHIILVVINVDIRLEPNNFGVSDIGTIEE